MWTAVALTTVMSLAPAQTLELKNVRSTYGMMGETRKDDKLLGGDFLLVAIDVDGLKVQDNGVVKYAMGLEWTKKGKAKPDFKQDPQDFEAELNLGGTVLPTFAMYSISPDAAPGEYTLKVTFKDRLAKTEKILTKTFEVLPPKLGFIQVFLTAANGDPVPPIAVPGQRVFVHCTLVGHKVNKDKTPNVTFEMVVEENGTPTVKAPFKGDITKEQKVPGTMKFLPRQLDLNKPGKYKIIMKATDNISKVTVEQTLNLTVLNTAN
jgi:hypothetical protein